MRTDTSRSARQPSDQRLYEIDRVISRTVSYVLLVVMLTGIYAGGVFLVQSLLPGDEPGDLAVAASTLAAAALFSSLRRRVQTLVDRRFNRSRYNAQRVVEDFSRRLRDQLDLNGLGRELETGPAPPCNPPPSRSGSGRESDDVNEPPGMDAGCITAPPQDHRSPDLVQ